MTCHKWRDGIALVGTVSGNPAGTGWMAQVDANLNVQWTQFNDDYAPGDITAIGAYLYILGWNGQTDYLLKIGEKGQIIAKHPLPAGDQHLVQSETDIAEVRVVTALLYHEAEINDFSLDLRGPLLTRKLSNVDVKKCVALPDATLAIFGSQFRGTATAAVTRVYKAGGYKTFLIAPLYQSPWYIDAVLAGESGQIAAVRQLGPLQSILEWVSFK